MTTRNFPTILLAVCIGGLALLAALLTVFSQPDSHAKRPMADYARAVNEATGRATNALDQVITAAERLELSVAGWRRSEEKALGESRDMTVLNSAEKQSLLLLSSRTNALRERLATIPPDALSEAVHTALDGIGGPLTPRVRAVFENAESVGGEAVSQAIGALATAVAKAMQETDRTLATGNGKLAETANLLGRSARMQSSAVGAAARARTLTALAGQLASAPDLIAVARVSARIEAEVAEVARVLSDLQSQLKALGRHNESGTVLAGRGALAFARESLIGTGGVAAAMTSRLEAPAELAPIWPPDWRTALAVAFGLLTAVTVGRRQAREMIQASEERGRLLREAAVSMAERIVSAAAGLRRMSRELVGASQFGGRLMRLGSNARLMTNSIQRLRAAAAEAAETGVAAADITARHTSRIQALQLATARTSNRAAEMRALGVRTKLLAVTAAMEAARAGESGRAFAAVATEVSRLAGAVADSAEVVERSIDATRQEAAAAAETAAKVDGMVKRMRRMQASLEARANEHSVSAREMLGAITQLRTEGLDEVAGRLLAAAGKLEDRSVDVVVTRALKAGAPALLIAPAVDEAPAPAVGTQAAAAAGA